MQRLRKTLDSFGVLKVYMDLQIFLLDLILGIYFAGLNLLMHSHGFAVAILTKFCTLKRKLVQRLYLPLLYLPFERY